MEYQVREYRNGIPSPGVQKWNTKSGSTEMEHWVKMDSVLPLTICPQ